LKKYTSLCISPDEGMVAACSTDKFVRVWTLPFNREIIFDMNSNSVKQVFFSPDSKLVVGRSAENIIRIWDIKSKEELKLGDADLS